MKSREAKRAFIRWFLSNYKPKQREAQFILNYIASHNEILDRVHFVDNTENCKRSFIFSEENTPGVRFQYKVPPHILLQPEHAYEDIKHNKMDELYIQVILKDAYGHLSYINALEENPHRSMDDIYLTEQEAQMVDDLLEKVLFDVRLKKLEEEIDSALDKKNRFLFFTLTEQYNEMKEKQHSQYPVPS